MYLLTAGKRDLRMRTIIVEKKRKEKKRYTIKKTVFPGCLRKREDEREEEGERKRENEVCRRRVNGCKHIADTVHARAKH